jgi:hypothetical protein
MFDRVWGLVSTVTQSLSVDLRDRTRDDPPNFVAATPAIGVFDHTPRAASK